MDYCRINSKPHHEWEELQEKKEADADEGGDRNIGIASLLFQIMVEELRSNTIKENQATSSAPLSDTKKMKNSTSLTAQSLLAASSIQSDTKLQQALQKSFKYVCTMITLPNICYHPIVLWVVHASMGVYLILGMFHA